MVKHDVRLHVYFCQSLQDIVILSYEEVLLLFSPDSLARVPREAKLRLARGDLYPASLGRKRPGFQQRREKKNSSLSFCLFVRTLFGHTFFGWFGDL